MPAKGKMKVLEGNVERSGFQLTCKNDWFKCAFITLSDQYAYGQVKIMKRHNESDEVFVLIKGQATLLTGDPIEKEYIKTELKTGTSFCVEAGTWHYLAVSEDALVFVVENSEVSGENTDAINVEDQHLFVEE